VLSRDHVDIAHQLTLARQLVRSHPSSSSITPPQSPPARAMPRFARRRASRVGVEPHVLHRYGSRFSRRDHWLRPLSRSLCHISSTSSGRSVWSRTDRRARSSILGAFFEGRDDDAESRLGPCPFRAAELWGARASLNMTRQNACHFERAASQTVVTRTSGERLSASGRAAAHTEARDASRGAHALCPTPAPPPTRIRHRLCLNLATCRPCLEHLLARTIRP